MLDRRNRSDPQERHDKTVSAVFSLDEIEVLNAYSRSIGKPKAAILRDAFLALVTSQIPVDAKPAS